MSTNSLTAADSSHHLFDLLFSPKAAFVWDGARQAVVWMNKAARTKFGQAADDLAAALGKATVRQLSALCNWAAKPNIPNQLKIVIKGLKPFLGKPTPLQLADGHEGLIVAELDEDIPARLPSKTCVPFVPPAPLERQMKTIAPLAVKKPGAPVAPPRLTEDEMRSFQALGRKVRKLCRTKKQALNAPAAVQPGKAKTKAKPKPRPAPADAGRLFLEAVLPAFDGFLKLDKALRVVGVEGRLQKIGWRKADVMGKPLVALFPKSQHADIDRSCRKVTSQNAKIARMQAQGQSRDGRSWTSRIMIGLWPDAEAAYFAAFVVLDMSPRLKHAVRPIIKPSPLKKLAA